MLLMVDRSTESATDATFLAHFEGVVSFKNNAIENLTCFVYNCE